MRRYEERQAARSPARAVSSSRCPSVGNAPDRLRCRVGDPRRLHLAAVGNPLDWEMLAQAARATGADDLLELATACHPQTLRRMRWTNTLIKTHSPQLLASAP